MVERICRALLIIAAWKLKDVHSTACTFEVTNSSGVISSNSSGNHSICSWVITAPVNHKIQLVFVTLQLTDSPDHKINCIRVYDGRSKYDGVLGVFTGTKEPFRVESNDRFMLIMLIKNENQSSFCNFMAAYTMVIKKVKPRVLIPIPMLRTVPSHLIWCDAEGTPPVNMSLFNSSTLLATGEGKVASQIIQEGNYTCIATNKFGTDSRDFQVTFTGCRNSCLSYGEISWNHVKNTYNCSKAKSNDDIFKCIPTTATHLILKGIKIKRLPMNAFRDMSALETLHLGSNEIQYLPTGLFSKPSMWMLDLSSNKIQNLSQGTFSISIGRLNLASNRITHLPLGIFSKQRKLWMLNLASNRITHLPLGIFSKQRKLWMLNLASNRITYLPVDVFCKTVMLRVLNLASNRIRHLPVGIFSKTRMLLVLKLSSNRITYLPMGLFSKQRLLVALDLSSNRITHLPVGIFSKQRLTILNLAGNKLMSISAGLFTKQIALTLLYLQNNLISSITTDVFSNLTSLRYLLLHGNRIQIIPSQAFKNLRWLMILMLSDNPIRTIGSKVFTMSNYKLSIYMMRTALENVSLEAFNNISMLKTSLSLHKGKIGTLKFMDSGQKDLLTVYLGLGQNEYIDLSHLTSQKRILKGAFGRSGFAKKIPGDDEKLFPCPVGTFVNSSVSDLNHLKCLECPPGGYYSDTEAYVDESCLECPNGTFVHYSKAPGVSQADCKACPQGTNTNSFAGFRACKCLKGFFRTHLFEGCRPCDQDGLECVEDYVTVRSGYWWKWGNDTHRALYEEFKTTIVNNTVSPILRVESSSTNQPLLEYPYTLPQPHKCPRQESCIGGLDSLCDLGYQGPLCEVCSAGYYKQLKRCKRCPTNKWMIGQFTILAAVIVIVSFAVVWTSKKKSKKGGGRSTLDLVLGRLKIIIGFYQVTFGLLEAFSYIKWPDSLIIIGKYSELLQFNILQIAPVHCLFPHFKVDAFGSLFAVLSLNAAATIVAFVIYGLTRLTITRQTCNEEEKMKKISHTKKFIYRNLFFFLYVTYLNTCSKTANVLPLACRTLCIDEEQRQCQKFLKADYNFECTGASYNRLVIVAYCAVFYIVFLPTASLIALWKQRRALKSNEMESSDETNDAEDKTTELLTGLRFLFENYNADSWYWELVETVRKVILTSGLILVGGESRAYVGLACVMSGLYGMLFALKKPIVDPFENKLMLTSLAVTFVNLGVGAVSKIPKEGIPSSIDPYVDNILFRILVIGANSLVIGLLVVQYIIYLYRYIAEWRKNPQWSFSCCLALLLPLNDLQGEIRGLTGRNVLKHQLQTGKVDMPSMSMALKESGAVDFGLDKEEERDRTKKSENGSDETETLLQGVSRSLQSDYQLADCTATIHGAPRKAYNSVV